MILAPAFAALALQIGVPALGVGAWFSFATTARAQEAPDGAKEPPAAGTPQPKRRSRPKDATETAPAAKAPATPDTAAVDAAVKEPLVAQLSKGGVRTCLPGIIAMEKQTLQGVVRAGRGAVWSNKAPDQRLAGLILAQALPMEAPLPKQVAIVVGSPVASPDKCDNYGIQVIPVTEKCSAIESKITVRGKKVGELEGVPYLSDVNKTQIMLIPSAGDGCVLVALRITYAD